MPTTRVLLIVLLVGAATFVAFAFTVVGLLGEALILVSVLGLLFRAVGIVVRRARNS